MDIDPTPTPPPPSLQVELRPTPQGGQDMSLTIPAPPADFARWESKARLAGVFSVLASIAVFPISIWFSIGVLLTPLLVAAGIWASERPQPIQVTMSDDKLAIVGLEPQQMRWSDAIRVEVLLDPDPAIKVRAKDGKTVRLAIPRLSSDSRSWLVERLAERIPEEQRQPTLRLLL